MPGQVDPQSVEYTDDAPSCDDCQFWQNPSSCQKVSGPINPQGYCKLFKALGGGTSSPQQDAVGGPPGKGDQRYMPTPPQSSDDDEG